MELRVLLEAPALRTRTVDRDAALVAAAREDPQAFLALYDRYFDRVLGYVRLRIRDASTCEDVASTVFTTALGQLGHFRGMAPLRAGCSRSRGTRCGTSSEDPSPAVFPTRRPLPSRTWKSGFLHMNVRRNCTR